MKAAFILIFILLSLTVSAQRFFVEPTEKGFEKPIVDKLEYENYTVVNSRSDADIVVQCFVDGHYNAFKFGNMFHGYVRLLDANTSKELARTRDVGKSPAAVNGFQAGPRIMQVIANKYLLHAAQKASANLALE